MDARAIRLWPGSWPTRLSPQWVAAVTATGTVLVAVLVGVLTNGDRPPLASIGPMTVYGPLSTGMGALVLAYLPRHRVGRLLASAGLIASVESVALSWHELPDFAWLSQWAWWPPFGLTFLGLLVFPDGHLPSRRWRRVAGLLVLAVVVAAVALAVAAVGNGDNLIIQVPKRLGPGDEALLRVAAGAVVVSFLCLLAVLWSLWRRLRTAEGDRRQQLACLLPGIALLTLGIVLDVAHVPGAWVVYTLALPGAMTIAVLRYHLYDLDRVVNRTLVWVLMTLVVVVGTMSLVTILQSLVPRKHTSGIPLIVTCLIVVTFDPLRRRVQRGVNHLLYGNRDEPYKVIAELSDLLGHTAETTAVLPTLTATIARSLQVPYVAIELEGRHGTHLVAQHGAARSDPESFDMLAHGEHVGRLLVENRTSGARFTPRECRLLGDVAQHAAVAAEATRLISDLQESRERLIAAREEERRRLRRDLHDGVGPALAGMSMQVRAVRKVLTGQERAERILATLDDDLRRCNAEMRMLVDQLRPPALDRGLEAALVAECARFDGAGLSVRLDVPDDLDGLPAAVEVVAYRILSEALTNVARHSRATTCRVTVRRGRALEVRIEDDGVGLRPGAGRGVGLGSMQERAGELGGDCTITSPPGPEVADGAEPVPGRGTTVTAMLPITLAGDRPAPPHPAAPAPTGSTGSTAPSAPTKPTGPIGPIGPRNEHGGEPAGTHRRRPWAGSPRPALDAGARAVGRAGPGGQERR